MPKTRRSFSEGGPVSTFRDHALALELLLHAGIEARDIDADPLVGAVADQFLVVTCLDLKRERAAFDRDQFGGGADAHSNRRGREVTNVEVDAEALVTRRQQMLDGGERRRLD